MADIRQGFVSVLSLGGTIAMGSDVDGSMSSTDPVRLGAKELVDSASHFADLGVRVETIDFRRLPSSQIGFSDLLR